MYTWGPQISQSQSWPKQWIPFHRWAGGIQSGYAYTGIGTLRLWPDRVVLLVLFQVLWESKGFLWMPLSSKIRSLRYKMKIFLPYLVSEVTSSISVCVVSHVFSQLELHKQTTEDRSCPIHSCKAHWIGCLLWNPTTESGQMWCCDGRQQDMISLSSKKFLVICVTVISGGHLLVMAAGGNSEMTTESQHHKEQQHETVLSATVQSQHFPVQTCSLLPDVVWAFIIPGYKAKAKGWPLTSFLLCGFGVLWKSHEA